MRYTYDTMLPSRAFQRIGGRMTYEGGGGGGYDYYQPAVSPPAPPAPPPPVILIPLAYISAPALFTFTVTGLRPNTRHYFYFNRVQETASLLPSGGALGSPLVTDGDGKLTFKYLYRALAGQPYDNEQSYYAAAALAVGDKQIIVGDVSLPTIDINVSTTFMSYGVCTVSVAASDLPGPIQQGVTQAQAATYTSMPYTNYWNS